MNIDKILVVGIGTMGQQISFHCVMLGFATVVCTAIDTKIRRCCKIQRHTTSASMLVGTSS